MKSSTCFNKLGKPLSEFLTEAAAQESADYERSARGVSLYPYQCNRCGLWHLAPQESRVAFKKYACLCLDSLGKSTRLYATREDAEKARISSEEARGIALTVYECPEGDGWHLTHRD